MLFKDRKTPTTNVKNYRSNEINKLKQKFDLNQNSAHNSFNDIHTFDNFNSINNLSHLQKGTKPNFGPDNNLFSRVGRKKRSLDIGPNVALSLRGPRP